LIGFLGVEAISMETIRLNICQIKLSQVFTWKPRHGRHRGIIRNSQEEAIRLYAKIIGDVLTTW